jgi:hypothetical protein
MAVPAGGFEPPPPPHARRAGAAAVIELPHFELPHRVRMEDAAFSRTFFRLRAQNLTGLICGAIMLFVSRQSGSMPSNYVSTHLHQRSVYSRARRWASPPAA